MDAIDLGPAAQRLADLVAQITDDELGNPTPCPAYTVGDLVEHLGGMALAFTAAANKDRNEHTERAGAGSGAAHQLSERAVAAPGWPRCLEEGLWRESLPPVLDRDFWRKPRFRVCVCAKIGYSSERTQERSGGHVRTWLSW